MVVESGSRFDVGHANPCSRSSLTDRRSARSPWASSGSPKTAGPASDWSALTVRIETAGKVEPRVGRDPGFRKRRIGCGEGIRTLDLRVMSPTSCRCSTPRRRMIGTAPESVKLRSARSRSSPSSATKDGAVTTNPVRIAPQTARWALIRARSLRARHSGWRSTEVGCPRARWRHQPAVTGAWDGWATGPWRVPPPTIAMTSVTIITALNE